MLAPAVGSRRGVIIPSYNSGPLLAGTVRDVLSRWQPVIAVIDGSTDGSERPLEEMAARAPGLHVLRLARNAGKGAAVHQAMRVAETLGLTHVATFDADGQHLAEDIPRFMGVSAANPRAMVLGAPVFGPDAPTERVIARRAANFFARLESGGQIGDSLFGFRVYPLGPALAVMEKTRHGRGYDFETHLAVHLSWLGVAAINLATPVRYPARTAGGVSHYRYLRDNLLLARRHAVLLAGGLRRRARAAAGRGANLPAPLTPASL